jgi:hypothetical protein
MAHDTIFIASGIIFAAAFCTGCVHVTSTSMVGVHFWRADDIYMCGVSSILNRQAAHNRVIHQLFIIGHRQWASRCWNPSHGCGMSLHRESALPVAFVRCWCDCDLFAHSCRHPHTFPASAIDAATKDCPKPRAILSSATTQQRLRISSRPPNRLQSASQACSGQG